MTGETSLSQRHFIQQQILGRNQRKRSIETTTCKREWNHFDCCSLLVGQQTWEVIFFVLYFHVFCFEILTCNDPNSLAATIKISRPELASTMSNVGDAEVISETPPEDFFARHVKGIEDIGEPINPCFFTNSQTDPTNWYSIRDFMSLYLRR